MDKWDKRFLELAKLVSSWSKDPSTKVGSVITNDNRIISVGFNGLPKGINDSSDILNNRELKYRMILHAEENAIHFSNTDIKDCTIYVYPFSPCVKCTSILIQNNIRRVVSIKNNNERWIKEFEISKKMFNEAKVSIDLYDKGDINE